MTTSARQPTTVPAGGGQPELLGDSTAPTPANAPRADDLHATLLALQARVAELNATAAADTQLLVALRDAAQLLEIAKDRAVRAVQAADASNEAIGVALGVTKQAISKRWPRVEKGNDSDGRRRGVGATADGDTTARTSRRRWPPPTVDHVEARLIGLSLFKRTAMLEVTRRPPRPSK